MLINLSNHPSTKWTTPQKQAAITAYNDVIDLPFPAIAPKDDKQAIKKLAKKYLKEIQRQQPQAVHLMGEMTFTYRLVRLLKKAGIPCIASTTNRIVEEKDGKKIVQFQFVRFREY